MMKRMLCCAVMGLGLMSVAQAKSDDVVLTFKGKKVEVKNACQDSVKVLVQNGVVDINSRYKQHRLTVTMKGTGESNRLVLRCKDHATITLDGLKLTSNEGAAIWLKNKKAVKIVAAKGTQNELTVAACPDTTMKAAVIFSKDKVKFAGKGELKVLATADGVKGVNTKDDITIDDLTLDITTLGNNLGRDTTSMGGFGGFPGFGGPDGGFGGPGGGMPPFGGAPGDSTRHHGGFGGGFPGGGMGGFGGPGGFNFDEMPDSIKTQMEEMRKRFEEMREKGEMPDFGGGFGGGMPGGGFPGGDEMPDFGGGFGGGMPGFGGMGGQSGDPDQERVGGFKERLMGKTKGLRSEGKITINSGKVSVKTVSGGAEGIEGKKGVVVNGGDVFVDAIDDAINANAPIEFHGGKVVAHGRCNDAIDANYGSGQLGFGGPGGFGGFGGFGQQQNADEQNADKQSADKQKEEQKKDVDAAILITGGEVYGWCHIGSPEEGMDCDFSPLVIKGGVVFSIGGGMGEQPSVPTSQTAEQPTVLLIGLNMTKGEKLQLLEGSKVLWELDAPMNYNNSASVLSHPKMQVGKTYKFVTKGYEKEFTLKENFVIVR